MGEHDEPISRKGLVEEGYVPKALLDEACEKAMQLFLRGEELAAAQGLILVDTKYEFGMIDGELCVIDEIHTANSSRYWVADEYEARFAAGEPQRMLDKENIRQWLIGQGYQGEGTPPEIPADAWTWRWSTPTFIIACSGTPFAADGIAPPSELYARTRRLVRSDAQTPVAADLVLAELRDRPAWSHLDTAPPPAGRQIPRHDLG